MVCSVSSRSRANAAGWLAALVALAASIGAATGAAILSTPPDDLHVAPPTLEAAVGNDTFDDSRPIQLAVAATPPAHLHSPATGKVTAFACEPGAVIKSGDAPLSVDGIPRLALATAVPLWRDLTLQARGDDVRALQGELARLGYPLSSDGQLGRGTLAAMKGVLKAIGVTVEGDTVPLTHIVWIPAVSTTISTCDVTVGAEVAAAVSMASFANVSPKVTVVASPKDLVPGTRMVQVGASKFPIDENGYVKVPDVASLGASAPSDSVTSPAKPVEAQLVLAEPVDVSIVPPNAVYYIEGAEGCVASGRTIYRVRVLGSRLGQSLVQFLGAQAPRNVDVPPRSLKPCV